MPSRTSTWSRDHEPEGRGQLEEAADPGAAAGRTVSVVVCSYTMQRWDLLVAALESVRRQSVPAQEVLLVVDHCPELLSRAADLTVRVVDNDRERGLSGARNAGVSAASGEVVVFLDDDACADTEWLRHLTRSYADPDVVGVGGHVDAAWQRARPAWFPVEFDWVVGCSYRGQPTTTAVVRNPIGANMSFRRSAVLAVGGFNTSVGRVGTRPVGCEETELSIRLARLDPSSRIVLEPRAVVRHHVPAERSRWRYFRQRCWSEGRSKAAVSQLTDPRSALAAERSYTFRTLPLGAARGVSDSLRRAEPGGLRRSLAITAGLGITAAGYAAGKTAQHDLPRMTPLGEIR